MSTFLSTKRLAHGKWTTVQNLERLKEVGKDNLSGYG